jgi:hypothetical protein
VQSSFHVSLDLKKIRGYGFNEDDLWKALSD